MLSVSLGAGAQAAPATSPNGTGAPQAGTKAPATKPAPLQLQSLDPSTLPDPFPPINPANFTASEPSVATVDSYLHALLGYDAARIWRVEAIAKTAAPGVSEVVALVSERTPNAKVLHAVFYVLPDGKHLIADGTGVAPFGADPYAENFARLKAGADGPAVGASSNDLLLVEFSDLQCPHCKEAAPIMKQLEQEFPKARVVFQNFPLTEVHPYAMKAAEYGVCVRKAQGDPAFFTYAQAVYDTQTALVPATGDATLAAAVTKAGGTPATISTCAALPATKDKVEASMKLGREVGVNQTPMLAINGRLIPLTSIPFETLKQIVAFQATLDGVQGVSASPFALKPRP
jgi:protein-disulfide isomerase